MCIARVDKGWLQYISVKLLQKVLLVGFTLHIDKCLGGVLHITVQYVQGRQLASRQGHARKPVVKFQFPEVYKVCKEEASGQ